MLPLETSDPSSMDSEIRLFYITLGGNYSDVAVAWIRPSEYVQTLNGKISSFITTQHRELWRVKTVVPLGDRIEETINLLHFDDDNTAVEKMINCNKVLMYFDTSPDEGFLHIIVKPRDGSSSGEAGDRGMSTVSLILLFGSTASSYYAIRWS